MHYYNFVFYEVGVVFHPQKSLFGVVLDLEAVLTKTPPIALMLKVCAFRGSFGR